MNMKHFATLLTDYPLDERRLGGLLMDISHTALAGSIQQDGLDVEHCFGNADWDSQPRNITVRLRSQNTAPKAALTELHKRGFRPCCALEFDCPNDSESELDTWSLVRVYAEHLSGWVATCFLDYNSTVTIVEDNSQIIHAPLGGKRKGLLLAASTLHLLA